MFIKSKKIAIKVIAVALMLSMLTGCGSSTTTSEVGGNGKISNKPVTLKMWCSLPNQTSATAANMGETELYKELEKRTGVHMEFLHPAEGQETENLNVLLATGDLPDIIESNWLNFPGGPQKALLDNYIIKLNDVMKKSAPNLSKVLKDNPEWDCMVKTDEGTYYAFPFLRGGDELVVYFGPAVRKDWLDELGLKVPVTIDDWYSVLKAFKEKKGAKYPLTVEKTFELSGKYGAFSGAFGAKKDFYLENGKVVYGAMQPQFVEFLKVYKKWLQEGLLDPDFGINDRKAVDAKISSGQSGAVQTYAGNGIGRYRDMIKEKDPKFDLVGAPYPVLKTGEVSKFGQRDFSYNGSYAAAITTKCKNVEVAAKWLDYGYGAEGHLLYNFGIEGDSFTMKDGKAIYTDVIMKNSKGIPVQQALGRYTRASSGGPMVQDVGYINQYLTTPQQKDAVTIWAKTDSAKYNIPPVTATPEESAELAKIMNEINTYSNEMFIKFIMGKEPLENFNKYVDQLKKMNIERAIEIKQAALDRYNKR